MLVGEVAPSIAIVGIVLSDGCLRAKGEIRGIFSADEVEAGEMYPLSVRKIRTPSLPMDFLLAIGLETISLGTTILVSEAP